MVKRNCKCCKKEFAARAADIARGWGLFCSKSCKAKVQEKRTGQYAAYMNGRGVSNLHPERLKDYIMDTSDPHWITPSFLEEDDTHPFSSEGLGQW